MILQTFNSRTAAIFSNNPPHTFHEPPEIFASTDNFFQQSTIF